MDVKYKRELMGTVNDTGLSLGEVSLITMAIMDTRTQNKLNQMFKLLYHKVLENDLKCNACDRRQRSERFHREPS